MIKPLEKSKIKEVMDVWLSTNIAAHNCIPREYWVKNYDVVKNEYLPNSNTFIYEEDNAIKAFVSVIDDSFIGALFVLEDYQGQGIGKKLLSYCQSLYPGLELGVYKDNINAVNFYKHCGFEIVSEQSNEDSGFMEYIMKWTRN
jgi:putative acetyltransferase